MLFPLLTAIHVLGVVIWIGGVAFVTIIVFLVQHGGDKILKISRL